MANIRPKGGQQRDTIHHNDVVRLRPMIGMHSQLKDIPAEWLKYVEPGITRGGFLPCWIFSPSDNQPMSRNYKIKDPWQNGKKVPIQRFVARMFFDFPDRLDIKMICRNHSCVNPAHIFICEEWEQAPYQRM